MSWGDLGSYVGMAFAVIWPLLGFGLLIHMLVRKKNLANADVAKYAASQGWQFLPDDDSALDQMGYSNSLIAVPFPGACNVVRGHHGGVPFIAFDAYSKAERVAAKSENQVQRMAVVAIAAPASVPWMQVYPENAISKALDDITFESDDFNKRFRVVAQDVRFAYDVLNPQNMERMLKDGRYTKIPFRFDGAWLWTWESGGLDPKLISDRLVFLADTVAMVPPFVWDPR